MDGFFPLPNNLAHVVWWPSSNGHVAYRKFPSIDITDMSFIKLQTELKPFSVLHCGDTPVANRNMLKLNLPNEYTYRDI